ncbi:MAG: Fumble [Candidatus Parcubacteria bacterium]
MLEAIGLDIGSTLTKTADEEPRRDIGLRLELFDGESEVRPLTSDQAMEMAQVLTLTGYARVGVTGVGAEMFAEAARAFPELTVVLPDGDAFTREINLQVAGLRSLARRLSAPLPDTFLLIGIGTGVSYTKASTAGNVPFPFGNPLGGGSLPALIGSLPPYEDSFDPEAHCDLLMKHRYAALEGTLQGEFVLATFGNAKPDRRGRITVDANSAAKAVATDVIRDLLMMSMIPDWSPFGLPIVFVGTSVDEMPALRHWLSAYCTKLGLPHLYFQGSAYAGAIGAYEHAIATVAVPVT